MHHVLVPASVASLALVVSGHPVESEPVTLAFAPAPGVRVERSITVTSTMDSGDLEVVMNDQPVPQQYLPDLSFALESTESVEIVDVYLAPTDDLVGHPLVREVTAAENEGSFEMDMGDYPGGGSGEWAIDAESPLVGSPFTIGRDADGATVAKWNDPESSPDASLLDGVRPEIDLAGLLPDEPVAVDDEWEADAAVLAEVLRPTGDLCWEWQGEGADYMPEDPEVELSGALELRFAEMLKGDVARIEITGELVRVETVATTLDEVPVVDGTATDVSTTTYAVEGEMLWDVGAGVLRGLALEGTGEGDQVTTKDPDQDGPTYESTTTHEAQIEISVECIVAPAAAK